MEVLKFQVLGKPWMLRVLKRRKFAITHGLGAVAATYVNRRVIDLGPDGLDIETIRHELVHAFFGELCLNSATLDRDAFEEITAEFVSKRAPELLKIADEILKQLHKII